MRVRFLPAKTAMLTKTAMLIASLLFAGLPAGARADVKRIEPADGKITDDNPVANIYYFGGVNQSKIKDLISTIDEINIRYRNIKKIYLYINSGGGDMDSGFSAYWAVKNSIIPITTVNMAVVGSAATMLFCASDNRQALQGARFILHPAAIVVGNNSNSYQPNNLARLQENLSGFNKMFADLYKKCTTFKAEEIDAILSSEDARKFILEEEALERGLIKGTTEQIPPASLSFYISDASGG